MKISGRTLSSIFAIGVVFVGCTEGQSKQPSEEELVDGYRQAHARRDLQAMLKLFCWDGVTPQIRQITEDFLKSGFDQIVISVKMTSEAPQNSRDSYVKDGVTYQYNLATVKWLAVENPPLKKGSFAGNYLRVGVKNGHYLITLMAPAPGGRPR